MTNATSISKQEQPAVKWSDYMTQGYPIATSRPNITGDDKVLAMGSCFANEIRRILMNRSVTVLPSQLPSMARDFVWYTPTSLLQEVKLAFGLHQRDPNDYWFNQTLPKRPKNAKAWQDPYRRFVYGHSKEELTEIIQAHDAIMRNAFEQASCFIFTLGLTEAWQLSSGNWACIESMPMDPKKATMQVLSVTQCIDCIGQIAEIIQTHRPQASLTMTISPVPLGKTYRKNIDVAVANSESKSTLRTALGEVCQKHPEIHYFPSYEMVSVMGLDGFISDGRHVKPEVVSKVLSVFLDQSDNLFEHEKQTLAEAQKRKQRKQKSRITMAVALAVGLWLILFSLITKLAVGSFNFKLFALATLCTLGGFFSWSIAKRLIIRRSSAFQ